MRKLHIPAEQKAVIVAEMEGLVAKGKTVRAAVEETARRSGLGERTLFSFLQKTRGVSREHWEGSLDRKSPASRPHSECHPEALRRFLELCRNGRRVTDAYRDLLGEAKLHGWGPIPSERTLRRRLDRLASKSERWLARRGGP